MVVVVTEGLDVTTVDSWLGSVVSGTGVVVSTTVVVEVVIGPVVTIF